MDWAELKAKGYDMQFPHCDSRILHAPGECEYCDRHPDWQYLREVWSTAFTGVDPVGDQVACPAVRARGEGVNHWGGNTAKPKDGVFIGYKGMYPQYVKSGSETARKLFGGLRDSLNRILERTRD